MYSKIHTYKRIKCLNSTSFFKINFYNSVCRLFNTWEISFKLVKNSKNAHNIKYASLKGKIVVINC